MTLSRFPKAMADNVDAVLRTAELISHVANSSGDLMFRDLDEIQQGLARSKTTFLKAMAEGQKSPAGAKAYMVSVNGPATLADHQGHAGDIEAAAAAWNTRLAQALAAMTSSDLIYMIRNDQTEAKFIERARFMPAAIADPLRQSTEMTALVAAFDAVVG